MTGDTSNRDPWKSGVGANRIGRLFGEGELWLRWGVPIGSLFGVRLRLHWVFIVLIVAGLVLTLPRHQSGIGFRLPGLIALLVLSFAHAMVRVWACLSVGGETDEVVLWPLGGLGEHHTARDPRAELRVALAGPALHALLFPILAIPLFALTGSWSVAVPNPLDIGRSVYSLGGPDGAVSWWVLGLWSLHAANLVFLIFHLCVPMLPFSAAEIMRCVIWQRRGEPYARWITAHVGLFAAIGLVLIGAVLGDGKLLIGIGAFGAAICWAERRRLQFLAGEDLPVDSEPQGEEVEGDLEPGQPDVDRILEKISEVGMEGLSGRERRVLKRATRRSRETEEGSGDSDE